MNRNLSVLATRFSSRIALSARLRVSRIPKRCFSGQLQRQTGSVKWFDAKKGYGFITSADGTDYFVHFTNIQGQEGFKSLEDGTEVEFDLGEDPRNAGRNVAVNVTGPGGEPPRASSRPRDDFGGGGGYG